MFSYARALFSHQWHKRKVFTSEIQIFVSVGHICACHKQPPVPDALHRAIESPPFIIDSPFLFSSYSFSPSSHFSFENKCAFREKLRLSTASLSVDWLISFTFRIFRHHQPKYTQRLEASDLFTLIVNLPTFHSNSHKSRLFRHSSGALTRGWMGNYNLAWAFRFGRFYSIYLELFPRLALHSD